VWRVSLAVFIFTVVLVAQFGAGIQGVVTDQTGGVIGDAKVTLTNSETRRELSTLTSSEGFYRFSQLAPGSYTVTVEKPGFSKQTVEGVRVNAEELQGRNVTLRPGEITQSVTVTEEAAPALGTEGAAVARSIGTEEVRSLPQLGRNPYELLRLTPGVFADAARTGAGLSVNLPNTTGPGGSNTSIFQTENQVPMAANGQRLTENDFQIDGVSVNSLSYGGAAVVTPNQESVKEIRVASNEYSAEYGRNSGAQIEVVSQNGTNQFHGSGIFKLNDPAFNAYNKYGGPNLPPVRSNQLYKQFGASVGGPVIRDKVFFFFSYEGLRNRATDFTTHWVETAAYRNEVVATRPNSLAARILNTPGMMPRVVAVAGGEPCPTSITPCQKAGSGIDIGSLTGGVSSYTPLAGGGLDGVPDLEFVQLALPSRTTGNQYNGRVDYNRGNDSFAASMYFTSLDQFASDGPGRSRPVGDLPQTPLNSASTVTWNRVFSPAVLNSARANFTRFHSNQLDAAGNANFQIPRIEIESLGGIDRVRFGAPRSETTPAILAQNTFEVRDNVHWVMGGHVLQFGGEIRLEQDNNNLLGGARPLYSFDGLFNFANDAAKFEQINADPRTGAPADAQRYYRTRTYGFFVQDDWKVLPTLTVNLGLRYEYFTPLREAQGLITNLQFGQNLLDDARVVQLSDLYRRDRNNFAPRVGFAWNPAFAGRNLVVRGGFGIYYSRIPNVLLANNRGNPPYFARFGLCCGTENSPFGNGQILYSLGSGPSPLSYPVNPALASGINPATNTPLNRDLSVEIWGTQPNLPNAYGYIYSLQTQYRFPRDLVFSLGYQGSTNHKLIRLVNQKFLYPTPSNVFSAVYFPQSDVNSNYNALLAGLTRQFRAGMQMAVNYRFSKSIDTLSYPGPGAVTNQTYPQDQSTERGPSDFDSTHNFLISGIYELPFYRTQQGLAGKLLGGFQLSGILQAHSGLPWTPKSGQPVSTPGGPTLSPTRPVAYFGGVDYSFDTDAFTRAPGNFAGGGNRYFDITRSGPPGIGRNVFRGPRYFTTDISAAKITRLPRSFWGESAQLELRANLYNLFNKLNAAPFNFDSNATRIDQPTFGLADRGLSGRVVEFQARVSF